MKSKIQLVSRELGSEAGQNKLVHSKLRILWIASMVSGINTYQTSLIEILNNLEKRGHSVALIGVQPSDKKPVTNPRIATTFIPCKYVPVISSIIFSLAVMILLPFYTVFNKIDFVFFQPDITALAAIPSWWISKLSHVKFVLDIRSTPVDTYGLRGSMQKLGFNMAVITARETFQGITIITPLMKREISETFRINPAGVGVWTSGVSADLFNPEIQVPRSKELRKKLQLDGKFIIFYHGVLSETRGILKAAEAMRLLRAKNPQFVLFLLGAGSVTGKLNDFIKEEGLEENVIVQKTVPYAEVPTYIAMSDVCIVPLPNHPYWNHQSPLKLMEYLAMEKPVILTDIPAHKSIVDDSDCAILIQSAQPQVISSAIQFAYENRDKLSAWGKTGRKIALERFTWEKIAQSLENYLLSLDVKRIGLKA